MDKINCASYWKPASRGQIHLIKTWEEITLKQDMGWGLVKILFSFFLFYFIVVDICEDNPDYTWIAHIMFFLALLTVLAIWGENIYIRQKKLWRGRIYTCGVTCIGRTVEHYRMGQSCYLDICADTGETVEHLKVSTIVMESIKHQDRIMAVSHNPAELRPIRLYPLHYPDPSLPEEP